MSGSWCWLSAGASAGIIQQNAYPWLRHVFWVSWHHVSQVPRATSLSLGSYITSCSSWSSACPHSRTELTPSITGKGCWRVIVRKVWGMENSVMSILENTIYNSRYTLVLIIYLLMKLSCKITLDVYHLINIFYSASSTFPHILLRG